jgi:multiple sugar transport system permease protein
MVDRKYISFKTVLYIILCAYAIITVIPFLWALAASFKSLAEISGESWSFLPRNFTFDNYREIFSAEPLFGRWLFNSIIVAIAVTSLNLIFNSMAGYALARMSFPGNKLWFAIVLLVLMIPGQVTLIPNFLILKSLGWLNSYQGLIVPNAVNATFIFMMRQFFLNFPKELEEAAALDGLSRGKIFWQVVLPLAKPALVTQAIFVFMSSWNNFLTPLVIAFDREMFTLPLGLNAFKGQYITYWNYIMAASTILTLPALTIYAIGNRYFIQGVTFTGSK